MTEALRATLSAEGEHLVISVPLKFKRRGGRKEIIAPPGVNGSESGEARRNEPLALTLARAHRWRDLLEAGRYPTVRALAKDLGLEWSYVGRIIRLTLLAPDIVEAIIKGEEPDGVSYRKLVRLPVEWEGQRREVGRGDQVARTPPTCDHVGHAALSVRPSGEPLAFVAPLEECARVQTCPARGLGRRTRVKPSRRAYAIGPSAS
jgi:hypothetical protein